RPDLLAILHWILLLRDPNTNGTSSRRADRHISSFESGKGRPGVQSSRAVSGIGERLHDSTSAFRRIFANPAMRRLQLAWACSNIGAWMGGLALAVYAFEQDGAVAVGLLAL